MFSQMAPLQYGGSCSVFRWRGEGGRKGGRREVVSE